MAFSRLTFSVWSPIFAIRASASRFLSCSSASWEASLAFRSPTWRKSHYVQVTCIGNDKYQIQLIFLNEFTDPYHPASFISSSPVPTLVPCAKTQPCFPSTEEQQHSVFWLLSEKCNLCQHQLEIYLLPSVCAVRETSSTFSLVYMCTCHSSTCHSCPQLFWSCKAQAQGSRGHRKTCLVASWRNHGLCSPTEHHERLREVETSVLPGRYELLSVSLNPLLTLMEMPTDRSILFPQNRKWSS